MKVETQTTVQSTWRHVGLIPTKEACYVFKAAPMLHQFRVELVECCGIARQVDVLESLKTEKSKTLEFICALPYEAPTDGNFQDYDMFSELMMKLQQKKYKIPPHIASEVNSLKACIQAMIHFSHTALQLYSSVEEKQRKESEVALSQLCHLYMEHAPALLARDNESRFLIEQEVRRLNYC